ncbi:MAG: ABC transporter permease [Thermoleophilia bacterium]|nr:ABC transporter permease [Thermoleophilia bacterium]
MTSPARALKDSGVVVWRQLIQLPRIPEVLVFALIQPVMFVVLFRYVFGGAIQTPGESYVNYLMPGIFAQTVAFGAVASGIGLAEDLRRGIIDRFRSLPMARSAVLVGRTVSDLVRNAAVVAVMMGVGLLVGFRPSGSLGAIIVAFGLLFLTSFAFSWIGVVIALSMKTVEAVQSAGFIWLFPLTFASSAFVPTDSMPSWLQGFAVNQPFTVVVNAVRALFLAQPVGNLVWLSVVWMGGISAVMIPLATRQYRRRTG